MKKNKPDLSNKGNSLSPSYASFLSSDRYKVLIDSADDWFWEIDKYGRYTFSSHQIKHILGYEPDELIGKNFYDLMPSKEAERIKKIIDPIFMLKKPFRLLQNSNLHKNGSLVCLETSGNPFYGNDNKFMGYRGIDRDITNRKKLEKNHSDLLLALDQMAEAALVVGKDLKIAYVNKAFYKLLGYSPEKIIGKPLSLLNSTRKNADRRVEFTISALNENGSWEGEVLRKKENGDDICVYLRATATYTEEGELTGYIGTYFDMEETKNAAEKLEKSLFETVFALSGTIEERDPYTFGHQNRVASIAKAIAVKLNENDEFIKGLELGAKIHDIGKTNIPTEILNKSGKLNKHEFGLIKTHAKSGYKIISNMSFPWPVAEMVLQHHERMDGSGYPQGLKNNEIILEAKIIGLADTVEAITSHRPYRPAFDADFAITEVKKYRGKHYDLDVMDAFLDLVENDGYQLINH